MAYDVSGLCFLGHCGMEGHEEEMLGKSVRCSLCELRENTRTQKWYGTLGLRSKVIICLQTFLNRSILHPSCCRIFATCTLPDTHVADAHTLYSFFSHSSRFLSSYLRDSYMPLPGIIPRMFDTYSLILDMIIVLTATI